MNIVVTGSSSGIGRALSERLLAAGHHVWGIARSRQADFELRHPGAFRASRCDVAHWGQAEAAAAEIGKTWTSIDGLIAGAGQHGEVGRALQADPQKWAGTVRANLEGTFNTLRAFDRLLRRRDGRAKVICFSGGGATSARPNFSAYGVAKTAIVRLVETIATEEANRPLDINAVAPGSINTRLTAEIIALGPDATGAPEFEAAKKQKLSGGAEMGNALALVEWLLSSASDGISGRLISAQWDDWKTLREKRDALSSSDLYTLRRIVPGKS